MLPLAPKTWRRIPGKINYSLVPIPPEEQQEKVVRADDDEGEGGSGPPTQQFLMSFSHQFSYASTETTYFAFSYPFSLDESTEMLDRLEEKLTRPEVAESIYFHREVLFYSLEGRMMEMFTISSRDKITDREEDQVKFTFSMINSLRTQTVSIQRVKETGLSASRQAKGPSSLLAVFTLENHLHRTCSMEL